MNLFTKQDLYRFLGIVMIWHLCSVLSAQVNPVRMIERAPDPHGYPRPVRDAVHVPLNTSFFFQLAVPEESEGDRMCPESLTVRLVPEKDTDTVDLISEGGIFVTGVSGQINLFPLDGRENALLSVYIEPGQPLKPSETYIVHIMASTEQGAVFADGTPLYSPSSLSFGAWGGIRQPAGPYRWRFTTEPAEEPGIVDLGIDFNAPPVKWHGGFFSGFCNVQFCTSESLYGPTYEMMATTREIHPRAWSYQRDFWLTGTQHSRSTIFSGSLPNIVREKETRRITEMEELTGKGLLLHLEDFFGHQQYGIPSGRPVSADYHPGYIVLVADGTNYELSEVLAVDDTAGTVLISPIAGPAGGWRLDYPAAPSTVENPDMPGLFAPGATYLRRFDPHGTAVYYWERVNKEWDMVVTRYGRRVMPNFVDAPGCLSAQGRSGVAPKDYVQYHEVTRTITGYLIDRYSDAALDFVWSVFNEPDLNRFWLDDWDELLRFYDYTVDAILRAFEDRGYDSDKVFVGGLELGGIFGANLRLQDFLMHCSPRVEATGEQRVNAAYADPRLDGLRSRRVETLCSMNAGRGSPCDFISIHLYNNATMSARKLEIAKQTALEIDEEFFKELWINSHEACPEWSPIPDPAFSDSYLGNGYFKTWTIDLVTRQLRKAVCDPRFAYGETIMTTWPPPANFNGYNSLSRNIRVDNSGGGRADQIETVPNPIFHVLTLLSDMGDDYWLLPVFEERGHVVSGFASRDEAGVVRLILYTHNEQDTQSQSDVLFEAALEIINTEWTGDVDITEYRFDRKHNSYFQEARELRDLKDVDSLAYERWYGIVDRIQEAEGEVFINARNDLLSFLQVYMADQYAEIEDLILNAPEDELRATIAQLRGQNFEGGFLSQQRAYTPEQAGKIADLAQLRATNIRNATATTDEPLRLSINVAGNGLNMVVLRPAR